MNGAEEAPMAAPQATEPRPIAPEITEVQMYDALASATRLWVRGRLLSPLLSPTRRSWWKRWRKANPAPTLLATAHIRTQVAGVPLETDVPVRPDGYFEASFTAQLPPARRGWRMARHQLTIADRSLLACNVVLAGSEQQGSGLIVVLPVEFTHDAEGVQRL